MPVRILTQDEVVSLLPMAECIAVMEATLRTLASGGATLPLRTMLRVPEDRGVFGVMPAHLTVPDALGLKAIAVFPGNAGTALDSHQGLVLLFDPRTGAPIAIMDASSITAIRTAAVSGVATRAMAREDAGDLAILGSGVQARSHLQAMAGVCRLRRVRAWSPDSARLSKFVAWGLTTMGVVMEATPGPREAVTGADLICTVSSASEPIVRSEWVGAGAHINAVGSSIPTARELDTATVVRGRLVVDRVESALHEAGDFLVPRSEGAITDGHILGELGDVLLGRVRARTTPQDVTIFKSLGIAVEDLAAAHHVLGKAEARGTGVVVDLGGLRG